MWGQGEGEVIQGPQDTEYFEQKGHLPPPDTCPYQAPIVLTLSLWKYIPM